jgi:hypothetical protein
VINHGVFLFVESLAPLLTAIKGLCLITSVVYNACIMADEKHPAETPEPTKPPEPPTDKPKPELTEDEQMAAYEEDLKNSDWGHQPC